MNCPICNITLNMTDKNGIEVDYCPKCRGVWLDRGELEKIIERGSTSMNNYGNSDNDYQNKNHSDSYRDNNKEYNNSNRPRKKESFLSDLFDF